MVLHDVGLLLANLPVNRKLGFPKVANVPLWLFPFGSHMAEQLYCYKYQ